MVITLKNKYQITLKKLIQQCLDCGGIPETIRLTPTEGWLLLKEISLFYQDPDYINQFSFNHADDVSDLRFIFPQISHYDKQQAKQLLVDWIDRKYTICFQQIPLYISNKD